jgi:hypothetical protein
MKHSELGYPNIAKRYTTKASSKFTSRKYEDDINIPEFLEH